MAKTFSQVKLEFDKKYSTAIEFNNFLPEHLTVTKKTTLKKKNGSNNEQYYKWQFFYSLVYSGMYSKDYIGTEVYFPKGNKNSAPIKFDGAIFDDTIWDCGFLARRHICIETVVSCEVRCNRACYFV